MTPQEAFDTAVLGTIRQGRGSYSFGSCRYRGPDGARCAIGHLIPDRLYDPEMEYTSAGGALANWPDLAEHFKDVPGELLDSLQGAHDGACHADDFVSDFIRQTREIADEYHLTYPDLPS